MKQEYTVMALIFILVMQNIWLRRDFKRLWQAMDKTKYINRYRKIISQTKDQT